MVVLLATLASGLGWAQIPDGYVKLSVQEINKQGLAIHGQKDYKGSAELFYYVTLLAPNEAYGHFNLACALSLLGSKDASVQELRRALESNRAWTEPNIKDPDLNNIRRETSYAELLDGPAGPKGPAPADSIPAPIPEPYRSLAPQAITKEALAVHAQRLYSTSEKLFRYVTRLTPTESTPHFNLACALSLLGRKAEAVAELGVALELDHRPRPGCRGHLARQRLRGAGRGRSALAPPRRDRDAGRGADARRRRRDGPHRGCRVCDRRPDVPARNHPLLGRQAQRGRGRPREAIPQWVSGILEVRLVAPDILEVNGVRLVGVLRVRRGGGWPDLPLDLRVSTRFATLETGDSAGRAGIRPVRPRGSGR
jgi:hypothetical protein